jgi:hypothetical protein
MLPQKHSEPYRALLLLRHSFHFLRGLGRQRDGWNLTKAGLLVVLQRWRTTAEFRWPNSKYWIELLFAVVMTSRLTLWNSYLLKVPQITIIKMPRMKLV